ncbi:MAG: membrane protein of unknown function [Candidatus Thorarchaeota archaeon]|nr:MAG: membrane protein of unknown function [Candidatus Thorarchaeota archaeon]
MQIEVYFAQLRKRVDWIGPKCLIAMIGLSLVLLIATVETSLIEEPFDFSTTLSSIGVVASVFTFGIPFSIGAVVMWTTPKAHQSMLRTEPTSSYIRRTYLSRLILSTGLSFSVLFIGALVGFVIYGGDFTYFPSVLVASLLVGMMLTLLVFSLALYLDSPKYTLVISTLLFLFLSFEFGWSPRSADDIFSLCTPYHLFRYLAVILSGYQFPHEQAMEHYMGVYADFTVLLGPLLLWSIASVFSILGSLYLLKGNMMQWRKESSTWDDGALGSMESQPSGMVVHTHKRIKIMAMLIVILFSAATIFNTVLIPAGRQIPEEFYLYQSPETGEPITLGSWMYDSVYISDTLLSQTDGFTLMVTILEWGGYSGDDGLQVKYDMVSLSVSQFEAMNETEREDAIYPTSRGLTPDRPATGPGVQHSIDDAGTYLWAFRFTDTSNETAAYTIVVFIEIYFNPV